MSDPDPAKADAGAAETAGRVLLGRFRVEKVLGRGGMGEVLLAHDTLLQRPVALKHLRTDGPQRADRRGAMLKEARRASQVNDHRIAAIHDVLDLGDDVLLVMEYVEGETLRERLREPLPLGTFWDLSRQCVEALGIAHAKGVIHRDIKPENLMLTREHNVKILDFGIALRSERQPGTVGADGTTATVERLRWPAGTPQYMAPEAHYGGHIDERTDIFSLGAVFYEMLTARHPFAGGGYDSVLDHIMNSVPEPAAHVNPDVPHALSDVVERMLARDPAQRFASCDEVALALTKAQAASLVQVESPADARPSAGVVAERAIPLPAARSWPRSWTRPLAWLASVAAALVAWLVFSGPKLPHDRNLALLLPSTPGSDREFAAFALGSVELLASRLQRHQDQPGFQLAPFNESRVEKLTSVRDARTLLGANLALVPSFERKDNVLRARLELREPAHGRLIGTRSFEVPQSTPRVWTDSLYRASLALLNLPPRRDNAIPDLGVRGAGTLRFLAQGIGRVHAAQSDEDLERARDDLESACRAEPDAATPLVWLAAAQLKSFLRTRDVNWLARAEVTARQAVALDPDLADAHRVLGEALVLLKRPAESVLEYRRACALDPTRDDAWQGYGRSHRLLGDPTGERAVYAAAIERRPHAFRPRWWLAQWEFQQGHVTEAIRAYEEMIRRAPNLSKGFANLGAMLVLEGEYGRAIDTLRHALALRPTATAYSNLGTAYFNTNQVNECMDTYNQALQFGEAGYPLWLNLGDAYFWLRKRPDQARDAYTQAVRLGREEMRGHAERGEPADPMIPAYLASVFPKLDQPDSARTYLTAALNADSGNVMVQYCAALTHWQLGERPRALGWLERAVTGGYPLAWLRDSPVHRDWRSESRFNALLASANSASQTTPSPKRGGVP